MSGDGSDDNDDRAPAFRQVRVSYSQPWVTATEGIRIEYRYETRPRADDEQIVAALQRSHDLEKARRGEVIRQFLTALFDRRTAPPGEYYLRAYKDDKPCRVFWPISVDAAVKYATKNDGHVVYYSPARRIDRDATNDSIKALDVAWVDMDPDADPHTAELSDWRASALAKLRAASPSMIVDSGRGFHGYWFLDEAADPEVVRAVNLELAQALGGDRRPAENIGQCMRPPGTFNRKANRYAELVFCDPFATVSIEQLLGHPAEKALVPYRAGGREPVVLHAVLAAVKAHLGGRMSRDHDGLLKVSLMRCPFHGDSRPSAVVFGNGFFHCSACRVNEPLDRWARRPEVAAWAPILIPMGRLSPRRSLPRSTDAVLVGQRGILARKMGAVTDAQVAAVSQREGEDLWRRAAEGAVFDGPDDLGRVLLAVKCHLLVRAYWLHIYLAQQRQGGQVAAHPLQTDKALSILGFKATAAGRFGGNVRKQLTIATRALLTMPELEIRMPMGGEARAVSKARVLTDRGVMTMIQGSERVTARCYLLHPAILASLNSNTPAVYHWHPEALQLCDEVLAMYQEAQRQRARHHNRRTMTFDLEDLAAQVGVPLNLNRLATSRGRYLREWHERFTVEGVNPEIIGLEFDPDTGRITVAPPVPKSPLLLGGAPPKPSR